MSAVGLGVPAKRHCVGCIVSVEDIISSNMARERSVRKINIIRSRFLDDIRSHTGSVEDKNKIPEEEEGSCEEKICRTNSVSI